MSKILITAALFAVTLFVGLQFFKSSPVVPIAEETLTAAKQQGFNYVSHFNKAYAGDPESLKKILEFHADAAGELGQRATIKKLEAHLGRQVILNHIDALDPEPRLKIQWFVDNEPAF